LHTHAHTQSESGKLLIDCNHATIGVGFSCTWNLCTDLLFIYLFIYFGDDAHQRERSAERFHKLSFEGQFQIGICLANSQVKKNGNVFFQISMFSKLSVFQHHSDIVEPNLNNSKVPFTLLYTQCTEKLSIKTSFK